MSATRVITPVDTPVDSAVRPPGSKSQTIRAVFVAALAEGDSRIDDPLDSEDTVFARRALSQVGVGIDGRPGQWLVEGTGGRLRPPSGPIDVGASGLTARAMIALAALIDGPTTVVGRDRLPERPMAGLVEALRDLGVDSETTAGGLPVTVRGKGALPGGTVAVKSNETTQFATALLLVAPLASGPMTVIAADMEGSQRYLELTVQTMEEFGARVEQTAEGWTVSATGYDATETLIEPDASAAVYPMVAAAVTGGRMTIEGLGSRSLQPDLEVARVLEMMGCHMEQTEASTTVDARGRRLQPVDVDLSGSPDGSLAVAVAALFADGPSRLRGLGSLRFKESDRLAALTNEIDRLGAGAVIEGEDLVITPGTVRPTRIETHGDHRMAMSFALVGLVVPGIEIADPGVVAKTWPGFWEMLESLSEPGR